MKQLNILQPITNKEAQAITGRKERQVRRIFKRIRFALGKAEGQKITIADFCKAENYNIETVCQIIAEINKQTA